MVYGLEEILKFAAKLDDKPKSERFTHKQRRERRQAMAKFSETHTNQETADHFGVTIPTVHIARREAGFSAKSNVAASSYIIIAKIIGGWTDKSIAKNLGVSKQFVNQVRLRAKEAGVYDAINDIIESGTKLRV